MQKGGQAQYEIIVDFVVVLHQVIGRRVPALFTSRFACAAMNVRGGFEALIGEDHSVSESNW